MSRSNPIAKNPATRFFQWGGGAGEINYYDKEKEEQIVVPFPFTFLVLDELNGVTGFSEKDRSGIWSNDVRDMRKEELIVRSKGGVLAKGLYANIKDAIKAQGGKYTKQIYIAYKDDSGELVIGHFKASGAALTAWIELTKQLDVYKAAVVITGAKKAKKGATTYYVPKFEGQNVGKSTEDAANDLDRELQAFLSTYLSKRVDADEEFYAGKQDDAAAEEDAEIADEVVTDDVEEEAQADDDDEEPKGKIKLSDVPF